MGKETVKYLALEILLVVLVLALNPKFEISKFAIILNYCHAHNQLLFTNELLYKLNEIQVN